MGLLCVLTVWSLVDFRVVFFVLNRVCFCFRVFSSVSNMFEWILVCFGDLWLCFNCFGVWLPQERNSELFFLAFLKWFLQNLLFTVVYLLGFVVECSGFCVQISKTKLAAQIFKLLE